MSNEIDELKKFITSSDGDFNLTNILDTTVGALQLSPGALTKVIDFITNPLIVLDLFYFRKFAKFYIGLDILNNESKIKLSDKLFGQNDKGRENAIKILTYINKTEDEKNIDFIVNATRAYLLDYEGIDQNLYFRIVKTISVLMNEDLIFIKNKMSNSQFTGNEMIHSLYNHGLMVLSTIDQERSAEEQYYSFTEFARNLDKFALSLTDEDRQKQHRDGVFRPTDYNPGLKFAVESDIETLFIDN